MSAAILPCPFCGEREEVVAIHTRMAAGYYQCKKCNARGPNILDSTEEWENRALSVWNERTRWWNDKIATTAQSEAKLFTDRGLMEAIYIMLRKSSYR